MDFRTLTPERPSESPEDRSEEERLQRERPSWKDWLELRTRWWGFVRKNLKEPMPPGVGWWQTLGNLLLTLLVFRFITGFALAMYYTSSPEGAYQGVRAITYELPGGSIVRGLHMWGSSFIVVVMVMHTLRTFFWGSYKKPRELTWLVGVLIFQVILAFSFTGYLLPWDQKAYWATVGRIRIAGTMPGIGDALMALIGGGTEVGAYTLSRFYAIHVMLLPASLVGLVAIHLFLVRKHHIAWPVVLKRGKPQPFYPGQLFKDAVVVLVGVGLLVYFAYAFRPALEGAADPTGTDFSPRPEWYFLGPYELLKVMPPGWGLSPR
ncbi:MAG: quinol:cytochrome C oxidoreductase [Armatimonadota bacterium]